MARGYLNSIYITFFSIAFKLFFASLAAYAFAKIDFKGRGVIFMIFLSTMMIPGIVTMIPQYILYNVLGITDTFFPLGHYSAQLVCSRRRVHAAPVLHGPAQ